MVYLYHNEVMTNEYKKQKTMCSMTAQKKKITVARIIIQMNLPIIHILAVENEIHSSDKDSMFKIKTYMYMYHETLELYSNSQTMSSISSSSSPYVSTKILTGVNKRRTLHKKKNNILVSRPINDKTRHYQTQTNQYDH